MPRPRTAAGDSSLSSSTTRVSAVRRVRRVQPLLSLLLSSSLLLLLNLLCGQVHCDPRIPRSERAALAAHELGAHIRELRQRIDASNDPTEKSILRSVLEAEFNHVNFQRANVLQQDQLKQRLAPSSAPHSQRTADTHDGVFSGAVDDADTLRPVVFVHIPKTGGRRFRDILESLLGQSRPAMVERDLVHKAVVENDFSFVHNQSWFYVHFDSAVLPTFLDILRVQGKLPRIVTFLRDPVQRLVSEYYSYGSELSLDEYARQLEARNRQALFLVGKGDQQVDDSSPSNPLGSTADAFVRGWRRPKVVDGYISYFFKSGSVHCILLWQCMVAGWSRACHTSN